MTQQERKINERNRRDKALGKAMRKANNNPNRLDEQEAAQRTADRMAATKERLESEGKLYRLKVPCGEIVGTLDLLKEYAKQLKLDKNTIQKL